MADYGTFQSRVADELARSDLSSQIALATLTAIDHYSRFRFWFNEKRGIFTINAGVDEYDIGTWLPAGTQVANIDLISVLLGTDWYPLERVGPFEMEAYGSPDTSEPDQWSFYGGMIRFWPTPNVDYSVRVMYQAGAALPSQSTDTHPLLDHAEPLIRARVIWDLLTNVIQDFERAEICKSVEELELVNMLMRSGNLSGTGRVCSEQF